MAQPQAKASGRAKLFVGAAPNEDQIHRGVVQFLRYGARAGVAWFHVPSGGARRRVEAARFVGLGAKPGVPDLLLIADGRVFALELKTAVGRLSPHQVAMHAELRAAGAEVATVQSLDAAIAQLTTWGLTRGARPAPASPQLQPKA
jgi:hypothetical protein